MTVRLSSGIVAVIFAGGCFAGEVEVKAFVDSIKSVAAVKKDIRAALTAECGTGSCWNSNATDVCNLVAALDVKVDYLITGTMVSATPKPELSISKRDLELMKLIFSQCKPTNYQYWSYGTILHVHYAPSPKVETQVNRLLGIKNAK